VGEGSGERGEGGIWPESWQTVLGGPAGTGCTAAGRRWVKSEGVGRGNGGEGGGAVKLWGWKGRGGGMGGGVFAGIAGTCSSFGGWGEGGEQTAGSRGDR